MKTMRKIFALMLTMALVFGTMTIPSYAAYTASNVPVYLFDAAYYSAKYSDLAQAFGSDQTKLYNHWITYGIKEGRSPSPVYDPSYYLSNNSDLKKAFGTDYAKLYEHWQNYGINEFRKSSAIYDGNYYKTHYSDLQKAFGTDSLSYIKHFFNYGMSEGRQASSSFNVTDYKSRYSDLQKAFGNNLKSYYYHYMEYGISESRNAKPSGKYSPSEVADTTTSSSTTNTTAASVANGTYTIVTKLSSSMVLDVNGNYTSNGTNVQIYTSNGTSAQAFTITQVSSGWYKIIGAASGKALDVAAGQKASGVNVQIYDYNGSDAQLWKFVSAGSNYYYIQNKLGYYLDVSGGSKSNGTNVQVYSGNQTDSQKWKLNKTSVSTTTTTTTTNATGTTSNSSTTASGTKWPATSGIQTYCLSSSNNTVVYQTTTSTAKYGTIYASDLITIKGYDSGSDRFKVTYPVTNGTKTGYVARSSITSGTVNSASGTFTASGTITAYRRTGTTATVGSISKNDKCYKIATSGNYTQVIYPISGGYKMGWIKTSEITNSSGGTTSTTTSTTNGGSTLPTNIYLQQAGATTCTLASATMMLRARKYLSGKDYSSITESAIKSTAWAGSSGLMWSWTYSGITVAHSTVSGISASSLKSLLDKHPEGIVLYCGNYPHAVFLTRYSGDTFYCADPLSGYSGKELKLASSKLGAVYGSQAKVLNNVTAYWYVSKY